MKKSIFLCGVMLFLLSGCSSVVEYIPEAVPLATAVNTDYTQLTSSHTETTASEIMTEIVPMTEPVSIAMPETETLPPEEKNIYDTLYTALRDFQTTVHFDQKIDTEEMAAAVSELERQHPEIFWINGYSMRYNDNFAELTFKIMNDYAPDTLRRMSAELDQATDAILQTISPDLSEYDQILQIHDYLVTHTVYDEASVNIGKGLWSTAYGCMINGRAVCQGYAQAFQILMNRLGIECGICSGNADGEAHAWNYIKLHDQYYWIDVTWDDPVSETAFSAEWVHHGYFLINDAMLFRSRTLDQDQFYPKCHSIDENYFVRNGNYLTGYEFSEIDRRLSEHFADGKIEVMFSTKEAYETAIQDLFGNEKIWTAQIFQSTGGSVNFQQDPEMYILRLIFQIDS